MRRKRILGSLLGGSLVAAVLVGAGATMMGQWSSGAGKLWTTDRVGIGVSAPETDLHIKTTRIDAIFADNRRRSGITSGIFARARSRGANAVFGVASAGRGVATGVGGVTNSLAQGWGMFSVGDIGATGAKLFRIDHPLDPANRYLNHFAAEGPEPYNLYRGNVTLDANGECLVELPDYFESINRDFHYQLTALGAPSPNLHVATGVVNNAFWVAGGEPGLMVSWTVTAIRNDRHMQEYSKPTEEDKPDEFKGTYLHPELYGQSAERGQFSFALSDE